MRDPVVLHVLEAIEGGTARHVVDVVRSVDGFEHHVAIPPQRIGGLTDSTAAPRMRDAGAAVHLVQMRRTPVTLRNVRALLGLRRLIRALDAQVVHGHSSIGGVLARLAAATTHRPCVYTPNGVATGFGPLTVERVLARRTARIIAVSPSEATLLEERHIASLPRLQVIPNGIESEPPASPAPVDLRVRLQLPPDTPLVGTVARLVAQKAPERFVALAAAVHQCVPDAHFVLIGDGALRTQVDAAVATSGVASSFHRLAELPDASSTLGQLDVFVLTSRFEGGAYAPLEAMRAGTPVVLSDVVGNRDAVEPGRSGFLVPQDAIEDMAGIVADLLTDADQRAAVGRAGQARVRARFDLVNTGRALAAVYGSLVAQSPDHL